MKKLTALLMTTALLTTAGIAQARDIGLEEAANLQAAGTIQTFEKLNGIVFNQHPDATIEETELEEKNGGYIYEVELRDTQGAEWDMKLNATDGSVLKNEQDD